MKLGFAICGSFCNHAQIMREYERLSERHELIPILSDNAARFDTRFGTAEALIERVEALAGRRAVRTIVEAEPLGPTNALDALVIAPCTGNTLARLAAGVTDNYVNTS
jgi:dipicolinate synthase subunit B